MHYLSIRERGEILEKRKIWLDIHSLHDIPLIAPLQKNNTQNFFYIKLAFISQSASVFILLKKKTRQVARLWLVYLTTYLKNFITHYTNTHALLIVLVVFFPGSKPKSSHPHKKNYTNKDIYFFLFYLSLHVYYTE